MVNIELLETLRKQHGYTQEKVAIMIGYESGAAYNRKIRGMRDFTIEDIAKLCKLFQVEVNELIVIN